MGILNRRDYYSAIPQLEKKLSDLNKYVSVEDGKFSIKIEDLYGRTAELTITAEEITSRVDDAEENISEVTQTAEGISTRLTNEVTARTTLIRDFQGGTITCYEGEDYGVYTNASGSVDIVKIIWTNTDPKQISRIEKTVASYGTDVILGDADYTHVKISSNGLSVYDHDGFESVRLDDNGSVTVGLNADIAGRPMTLSGGQIDVYDGTYTIWTSIYYDTNEAVRKFETNGRLISTNSVVAGRYFNSTYTAANAGGSTAATLYIADNGNILKIGSSSRRYKEAISMIMEPEFDPHRLYDLPVVQFKYKDGYIKDGEYNGEYRVGFIAEDVEKYYPNAAVYENGQVETWSERIILPPMLSLIQELNDRVIALERGTE